MKARLVQIGNSRGAVIVISPSNGPRAGWEDAAKEMHVRGEDELLEPIVPTRFDEEEWEW